MTPGRSGGRGALVHRGPIPRSVVDGLPMPVMVCRVSDDVVVHVNPEFTAAYGHDRASAVGRAGRDLHFVPDDRHHTLERQKDGDLSSVEVRIRSSDEECMWAQADVSLFSLDGEEDVLLTTLYDIGDRKQAEAAARRGEEIAEEMARFPQMNPGPVLRLDLDGVVTRSNAAARMIFGNEVVGSCFWDLCPDFPTEARERALAGAEPAHEDVRVGDAWYRMTVTRPGDADQVFVFGSDVTSQKAAEQELADRARFPSMNPGAVARLAMDGTVIRANPAASSLFGRDDIQGESWLALCPGADEHILERARASGGVVQYEADIGERCFSFTVRHEPNADQIFVYGSDVTELKMAERALSELARFPDMNPGPVCRLDREGRVLLANRAALAVFGADDLTGASWFDLVPAVTPAFWERMLASAQPVVVEAKVGGQEYVLTHAPGPERIFVFVYGSDVTREKEAERQLRQSEKMATLGTLAAGVAHELNNPAAAAQRASEQLERAFGALQTARLRLDAVLDAELADRVVPALEARAREAVECGCDLDPLARSDLADEMEAWLEDKDVPEPWEVAPVLVEGGIAMRELEELAGEVGDERVGTVLTWYACTQQVHRLLQEIRHGTDRLVEIVGAMKAYSYLGQAPVQNVDVNEGIRSTLVILRSKLKAGIVVDLELAADLPRIEAFGSELNQVWTNLLDNAADAMDGRGRIRLSSGLDGDHVVVVVEDDGPGVPPEIQSRVYDAFFTTKPPGRGTGLGLNTTYNIVVKKHAGTIALDSVPGRTRFTVRLPVSRPTPDAPSALHDGESPT